MILNNDDDPDEADDGVQPEGTFGEVNTGRIKRDTSLHDTFATSVLASMPIESINISGLWYGVKEPAPGLGSHEQHGVPSAPI